MATIQLPGCEAVDAVKRRQVLNLKETYSEPMAKWCLMAEVGKR